MQRPWIQVPTNCSPVVVPVTELARSIWSVARSDPS
jgi:hypothetical protein